MKRFILVSIVAVVTIFIVLSSFFVFQYLLIENNLHSGLVFVLIPLNAFLGLRLAQFLLLKSKLLPDSKALPIVHKRNNSIKIEYNFDDKLAYYGTYLSFFGSFFLSALIWLLMSSYNQTYHFDHYGVKGNLVIQSKESYVNHGDRYRFTGKLLFDGKETENVSIEVSKEKFEKLKVNDSILVFFSSKDNTIIKELE
ncbi:MAG: hypothetical protein SFU98_11415 [Leptospiraceae bacterium]|nr:hypothetical protein [Leptospiraceae bacterium]